MRFVRVINRAGNLVGFNPHHVVKVFKSTPSGRTQVGSIPIECTIIWTGEGVFTYTDESVEAVLLKIDAALAPLPAAASLPVDAPTKDSSNG